MKEMFYCLLLFACSAGAQEWRYLGLGPDAIVAISVDRENPNIIYAGSNHIMLQTPGPPGLFKSTNGGVSWDTLLQEVLVKEIIIHPKQPNTIYATGVYWGNMPTAYAIIKSTDGGIHWTRADSGIQVYDITYTVIGPLVIDPIHPDTLYAGTAGPSGGRLYRSINGGTVWYSIGDRTELRNGVTALAVHPEMSNTIYAGTAGAGDLLKSTDYGVTWSLVGLKTEGRIISAIQFGINSSTIYMGAGGIYKTTDAGATWSQPQSGMPDDTEIRRIQILSAEDGERVFLTNGLIYESVQAQEWKKIETDSVPVWTIAIASTRLYAGCKGVYVRDVITSVSNNTSSQEHKHNLYDNFPNPFNSGTKITYEMAAGGHVSLEIYDILGRKIKTLVRNDQPPGEYTVYWNGRDENGSNVSSGVYLYILHAKDGAVARKMIYLP